ncbi:MAG: hypothetical protein IPF94_20605 [Betaproteobacteria bacterium]|nr:hypothetical protein [Betaproteobacteria bacterium]
MGHGRLKQPRPDEPELNLEANVVMRDYAAFATREKIENLMQQRCEPVLLPTPRGQLRSAWIALRSVIVYPAIRHFAAWARCSEDAAPLVIFDILRHNERPLDQAAPRPPTAEAKLRSGRAARANETGSAKAPAWW